MWWRKDILKPFFTPFVEVLSAKFVGIMVVKGTVPHDQGLKGEIYGRRERTQLALLDIHSSCPRVHPSCSRNSIAAPKSESITGCTNTGGMGSQISME